MRNFLIILFLFWVSSATALDIASMKARAETIDKILEQRFAQVLPEVMEREGIDLWVVLSREYNEDPVLKTMLPSTWLSARRYTMLVIYNPGQGKPLEKLAVARYAMGDNFIKAWDKEQQPDQWQALADVIQSKNPNKIAVDRSLGFALADGMSSSDYDQFIAALGEEAASRVVSAEPLAIAWLETRSNLEMAYYPKIAALGHELIATAFSNAVIEPGVTTTEDVVWWLRDKSTAIGVDNWFHPSVSIQRADTEKFDQVTAFSESTKENVILPGDLIHVDFGITYLRLNTDQQQHAYILKKGETAAPESLEKALANSNRLQDILTSHFKLGRTGNEILKRSRDQAIAEGLKPSIYTHPIGFHGHAAGPAIGMWDAQGGVPITGDFPMHKNTAYSIELNTATDIPEWNKEIRIMLEEEAFFDGETVHYIDGRQREFHLIKSE